MIKEQNGLPDISVAVVCLNEEHNIGECLESLIVQDYKGNYEIIVVDGNSKDRTQEIVRQFAQKDNRIRMVVEYKKGTSAGRNAAVRNANSPYIAFTDADCVVPSNWLSTLVSAYISNKAKDKNVVAVGGSNFAPHNASSFVKSVNIVLNTFLGSFGSVTGKSYNYPKYVTYLPTLNVIYEKMIIEEIGYFDETLESDHEDADLNYRLIKKGYRLLYVPGSYVWHKYRPSPWKWWNNMFRYGRGRGKLLTKYRSMLNIFSLHNILYLLPAIFIIAITSSIFSIYHWIFLLPLLYFPVIFLISVYEAIKADKPFWFHNIFVIYLITHFAYGVGELYFLTNYLLEKLRLAKA